MNVCILKAGKMYIKYVNPALYVPIYYTCERVYEFMMKNVSRDNNCSDI